jgi:hypothetical protein
MSTLSTELLDFIFPRTGMPWQIGRLSSPQVLEAAFTNDEGN